MQADISIRIRQFDLHCNVTFDPILVLLLKNKWPSKFEQLQINYGQTLDWNQLASSKGNHAQRS